MDVNLMKKRLDALNAKASKKTENQEFKSVFFKPVVGKQTIRIVPSKFNPKDPFTEMYFYYDMGGIKTLASPINWKEKDPIVALAKQLRQTNEAENWKLAKKLDPKVRYMVPVVVRGEEDQGVKIWSFGKEVYQDLLNIANDDEIGDIDDVAEGRDIKLVTVGPEVTGTRYNKTTVSPSMKVSPLAKTEEEITALLETQPNPKEVYKRYTFDEIKEALSEWLTPEDEPEGSDKEDDDDDKPQPPKNKSSESTTVKKGSNPPPGRGSNAAKFKALFDDNTKNPEEDDLPF